MHNYLDRQTRLPALDQTGAPTSVARSALRLPCSAARADADAAAAAAAAAAATAPSAGGCGLPAAALRACRGEQQCVLDSAATARGGQAFVLFVTLWASFVGSLLCLLLQVRLAA